MNYVLQYNTNHVSKAEEYPNGPEKGSLSYNNKLNSERPINTDSYMTLYDQRVQYINSPRSSKDEWHVIRN